MHRVVALTPSGIAPFELGIVVEIFGLDRPELEAPWWYALTVAAEDPGPQPATAGGFSFVVEHGLEALETADTIIVPGWHGEPSAAVVSAVRAAHRRGARLVSICSGVFLIAATGLLDGREAATHWRYASTLAERNPERIERTIYLASFMLPSGKRVVDYVPDRDSAIAERIEINRLAMWDWLDPDIYREGLYADCSDDDIALARALLVPEPMRPALTRLEL